MKGAHRGMWFIPLIGSFLLALLLSACGSVEGKTKEINIGYQKNGTTLSLKKSEEFTSELAELGYKVTWSEFNTGSSILEALSTKSIDFAGAGDIPSLFALDKGSDFRYIGGEPDTPFSEGILAGKNTGIQTVEDLKGKRIAFNKASIAQYLLIKSLNNVGLTIDDVEPVILNPPEASIAFEQGQVDAWVVWDPYLSVSESKGNPIIQTAEGIVPYRSFYFATPEIVDEHPELIQVFIKHLGRIGKEIDENPQEAAKLMEEETKIAAETWEKVLRRKQSNISFMTDESVLDLQTQVEDLLNIGLIENEIEVEKYIWYPKK